VATGVALRTHLATVDRIVAVTPGVRRLTFTGDDVATYRSIAPDQFLYLLLPPPGRPDVRIGRDFDWIEDCYARPDDERPVGAHYTVRRHRPAAAELDVDVVLHDHPGPASAWAASARPGDEVALWGPRAAFDPPEGTDAFLLVADETGVPAAAAILEHLADQGFGGRVRLVAEVAGPEEEQPLATEAARAGLGVDVTWLHRHGEPPGVSSRLVDAVCGASLPGRAPYVWGGGESRAMTGVRRHVRRVLGLPRERVSLTPYWRHALHADDPDDEAAEAALDA